MKRVVVWLVGALLVAGPSDAAPPADTTPIACASCDEWNEPHAPFRLFGNTWYVGTKGLGAVLIATSAGLVLVDGGLPQSAARIADNITALGHRMADVRWILVSHAHFDHAGGVAALARMSGAKVAASRKAAEVLRTGRLPPDDPQVAFGDGARFPAVRDVVVLRDGQQVRLGSTKVVMHETPGHTPGGMSWTWSACEGSRCVDVAYVDSLNPVSAPGFRFSDDLARLKQFRRSIDEVRRLPCDLVVSPHPSFTHLFEKQAARQGAGGRAEPLLRPGGCRLYADDASAKLDRRLIEEGAPPAKSTRGTSPPE